MIVLMNCALMYSTPVHPALQNGVSAGGHQVFNEVETVFELITEEWLNIENCVPEQDTEDGRTDYGKAKTFDWYRYIYIPEGQPFYVTLIPIFSIYKQPAITPVKLSPSTPPPDVA